jgi:hypothetical protein
MKEILLMMRLSRFSTPQPSSCDLLLRLAQRLRELDDAAASTKTIVAAQSQVPIAK